MKKIKNQRAVLESLVVNKRSSRVEKEMATHSSTLAWRIPWMKEPGGLHTVHGVPKCLTQISNFTFTFFLYKQLMETVLYSKLCFLMLNIKIFNVY